MAEFDRYFGEGGDDAKFRYNYDINKADTVIDVGAYHGAWSKKIYDMYKCNILAFEPVYHEIARKAFDGTTIILNTVGLGHKNEELSISVQGDGTSIHRKTSDQEQIVLVRDFIEVMNEYNVKKIKLLKINIEGCEYDLLDHIIDKGYVSNIANIQVQFHDFFPNAIERRRAIHEKLVLTHTLTYNFEFVWENWVLK